ncbi:MAG: hypothetical protein AB1423_14435 [Pseudomonadota bacterium]
MATKNNDISLILEGKTIDEQLLVLSGISGVSDQANLVFKGVVGVEDELDILLSGKTHDELGITLNSKSGDFLAIRVKTADAVTRRRLTMLDTLNLRTTAVYRNPRSIEILSVVFGDFSQSRLPCIPLDAEGYLHHASDIPMQMISTVFVEDEPVSSGFRAYPAYQDETGRSIACVKFDNPQYDKKVSISGKGAIKLDSRQGSAGELIENPADLIRYVFLNIQGYDEDSIDLMEISKLYADCLREGTKTAVRLSSRCMIKSFLDELAINIHGQWMILDGKSVMRLRWL